MQNDINKEVVKISALSSINVINMKNLRRRIIIRSK